MRVRRQVVSAVGQNVFAAAPAVSADAVRPEDIPSIAILGDADRVLAEIDQDGYEFAAHPSDLAYFRKRDVMLPRIRYRISVVLRRGTVCLRKEFIRQPVRAGLREWLIGFSGLAFFTEAAALLALRDSEGAPRIVDVDLESRVIYREFIRGESCRQILARAGLLSEDIGLREVWRGDAIPAGASIDSARALLTRMNARGVVVLDVKLGNMLLGERTGAPYWIDLETARFREDSDWNDRLATQERLLVECYRTLIRDNARPLAA